MRYRRQRVALALGYDGCTFLGIEGCVDLIG